MFPARHSKCQNRENCTGPGCKVKTGKTTVKNSTKRERRPTNRV